MLLGDNSPRPVPAQRNCVSLQELISLRHWPPARTNSRQRMSIRDGHHLSQIRGRGMEYDDVREYQPGDDIRHLDWLLMARTGIAHTKLYREERERPVFVVTDLRPNMHFATRGHFKSVLASYAAAIAVWTTLSNGDRVGGHLLGKGKEQLFKPSSSRQQAMGIMAQLSQWSERQSAEAAEQNEPDANISLVNALAGAERYLTSGTLVYLLSDFHDVNDEVYHHLMRLAQRCELKLVLISDPLEQVLPQGKQYHFYGDGRDVALNANRQQQQRYHQYFDQRIQLLESLHNLKGVEFAQWQTHQHPLFNVATQQGVSNGL